MNRYLTLAILVIIYSFSYHFTYDYSQAIDDQEINLDDNQNVDNHNPDYPSNDNGKLKDFIVISHTVLVLVVLSITSSLGLFASFTRRLMLLTTIFYQSNYLINSLK